MPISVRGSKSGQSKLKIGVSLVVGVAAVSASVFGFAASASAVTDHLVTAGELGTAYATGADTTWLTDTNSTDGTDVITTDAFDGRSALRMNIVSANSQVNVFKSFGPDSGRPTNVAQLLAGSSFSYAGGDVNFQLGFFYTPIASEAATYGPGVGGSHCTQAADNGVPIVGECYTIIKFDPKANTSTSWSTTTLADKQQPYFLDTSSQAGWWNTKGIGALPANARNATLDQMLGHMADYQIYAVGASIGGTNAVAGTSSWLLNMTFGGTSYSFGTAPVAAPPAAAPAADTDSLNQIIATDSIDVASDTAQFAPSGATNSNLSEIDASQPVAGDYRDWQDPTDAFADVYSYSDAAFVGTFPIVDGNVVMTGMNLSALGAGVHHLVLRGQTSGTLAVVQISVLSALAFTGFDARPAVIVGSLLLLLGVGTVLFVSAVRAARRRRRA